VKLIPNLVETRDDLRERFDASCCDYALTPWVALFLLFLFFLKVRKKGIRTNK